MYYSLYSIEKKCDGLTRNTLQIYIIFLKRQGVSGIFLSNKNPTARITQVVGFSLGSMVAAGKLIFNLLIDKVARCASNRRSRFVHRRIFNSTSWGGAGRPVRPERIPRSHYPRALPTADSPFPRRSWRKSARPNHNARAR